MNWGELILGNIEGLSIVTVLCLTALYFIVDNLTHRKEKNEVMESFSNTVNLLSSDIPESQLSAAILLRRFLNLKLGFRGKFLFNDTINVISSLLRTLPTGIYQKTLGDGLAFAIDLSEKDLQRTNMQDLYLGNKKEKILMTSTDMFMADLSYALLENIEGHKAIFYNSRLLNTQIKNCDFTNANFEGADLTKSSIKNTNLSNANFVNANLANVLFENVILAGANFKNALNIPEEIKTHLENGVFHGAEKITTVRKLNGKKVFFSMPGILKKEEELIIKEYHRFLSEKGYEILCYSRDNYPKYGQLNKVRLDVMKSSGMIAFGFKQINIIEGKYRPNTCEERALSSQWLTTPWTDIEVGMAVMYGIPVLLVHDKDISEGVFDSNINECYVGKICADMDMRNIESNYIFNKWMKRLEENIDPEDKKN
ncbi:pentapeptide repeat-containing protein [uncultured Bacteroides sp.]|uniref:pentapeptide repeat-containing protein n=1 Tax=uncultured Bacteroides sp. TaxID=162156 RepID=UPI0026289C1C|nr:pentapeptide repeat-containing protein [uncultured Bacteroides sp.]